MTRHVPILNAALLAGLALGTVPGAGLAQDSPSEPLYRVVNGNRVDAQTLIGFRTWRAAACDRCHGPNQEGMVGPSLINSLKTLSQDEFNKTVIDGRLDKGMPSFGGNPGVAQHLRQLYAYLKGRSDGAITRAKVEAMP